jgi:hypothetical protein
MASFGTWRRSRLLSVLGVARYACGRQSAAALPETKIYHLWMGTTYEKGARITIGRSDHLSDPAWVILPIPYLLSIQKWSLLVPAMAAVILKPLA